MLPENEALPRFRRAPSSTPTIELQLASYYWRTVFFLVLFSGPSSSLLCCKPCPNFLLDNNCSIPRPIGATRAPKNGNSKEGHTVPTWEAEADFCLSYEYPPSSPITTTPFDFSHSIRGGH
ncbi:hypothetical protein CLAIMM_10685 [Cladophialophora immunda]|nr:hypothetical protein CLAIMM_10685 [Cladophialophora immunda]